LDLCVHYAIKINYERDPDASYARLERLWLALAALPPPTSLLLVSGGGARRRLDTVAALKRAARSPAIGQCGLPVHVAFNPYFPGTAEREEERGRLRSKLLESGSLVAGVYLQMGTDTALLRSSLAFLDAVAEEAGRPVAVHGSVLVPSRRLLAQLRFRPWAGLFLSEEYMGGVEGAEAAGRTLAREYEVNGVAAVLEGAGPIDEELGRGRRLLEGGQMRNGGADDGRDEGGKCEAEERRRTKVPRLG
jgi:hypothetical protein